MQVSYVCDLLFHRLTSTVDNLEVKCAELTSKLEEVRASEKKRRKHEQKRSWNSVPSLVDASPDSREYRGNFEYLGFPSVYPPLDRKNNPIDNERLRQTKETLREVRLDLVREQRRREDSASQVAILAKDNKELRGQVKRLEKDQEQMTASEHESYAAELYARSSQIVCRSCHRGAASDTSSIADPELIEHDLDELPRGEVVRLKCGGSAYGSRESLNMIGLEADDDIICETGSDILVTGQTMYSPEEEIKNGIKRMNSDTSNMSLLGELEVQYRKLVRKYERLIEAKSQRTAAVVEVATQDNLDQVPPAYSNEATGGVKMRPKSLATPNTEFRRSWRDSLKDLDMRSPVDRDPIEGHFENGPPEYKRLFKEIFETLQRSVAYEEELNSQLDKSSFSSPEDVPTGLSG